MLGAPLLGRAQQRQRTAHVGYLALGGTPAYRDAILSGLREEGYLEGRNLVLEERRPEDAAGFDELARDLVRAKVNVILAWSTPATLAARRATSTIPIVMTAVGDPVGAKLVTSLAHPEGNITGISNGDVELAAKRLEILMEAIPHTAKIAVLRNPHNPSSQLQFENTIAAARRFGIEVQLVDAHSASELDVAFNAIAKARAHAICVTADPLFLSQRNKIAELARQARIASSFARSENAEAGGLLSYGPSYADIFRRAGKYAGKILNGAKPRELPVEQAGIFELVINNQTAKAIGVEITRAVLLRANRVIE